MSASVTPRISAAKPGPTWMASIGGSSKFYLFAPRILQIRASGKTPSQRSKARNDLRRQRLRHDFAGVVRTISRPDPGFAAFHCYSAAHRELVFDVEARAAKRGHLRCEFHDVAKARRRDEAGAGVDQGNAEDTIDRRPFLRFHAEHMLEHRPGAVVEILEKTSVEDDAGGIAVTPGDGELAAADEIGRGFHSGIDIAEKHDDGQPDAESAKRSPGIKPDPRIMTGELAPARHVPSAAT